MPDQVSANVGVHVGPYRLVRRLGSGGMGDVHLARRDDGQFSKLVALKRLHVQNARLRERFWAERQILAHLNHPNIAALLDGGETPEGQLYVVMEYVDGKPLLDYCAQHQVGVEQRLGLFLQICAAVQHAHQNLFVHRDLKPSNILVTADGTVKLIDFGIAKVLFPDLRHLPAIETQMGDLMMTPLYASPEQVRGERVATSTDVYSLGVVLFELLTGELPYAGSPLEGAALSAAICGRDPRPLRAAVAEDRPKLRARLQGDLENIVAMALRKEPERRYGSVEQFAADIQRHLDGFPVSARPDTKGYRLARFVGRHRASVGAGAAFAVLLAASSAVNYRMARQAEQDRDTANTVTSFLASIFAAPGPQTASDKEVTARELLERGEARIEKELRTKPAVQARIMVTIAQTYKELGHLDRASALYDRALAQCVALYGERHPEVAEVLREKGRLLQVQGKYEESERLLRRALAIQQDSLPRNARQSLQTASVLGLVLQRRGQLKEAAAVLKPALEALDRAGESKTGSADDLYEDMLNNYSLVQQDLGYVDESEQARRKLMELDRRRYGEQHINYAMDLATVGTQLREREALEEAEPLLRRSLELQRKILEPSNPMRLHGMQYLAICLQSMKQLEEAEALWNELRPARIKLMGEKNRFVASDWIWWGDFLRRKGDLAGAEAAVRKGMEIRSAVLKPDHPLHAHSRSGLGRILADKGDLTAAEAAFRSAYQSIVALHGADNPRTTATAELELGRVLARMGRREEAERLLRHSYETRRARLPAADAQLRESKEAYEEFVKAGR